MTDADPTDKNNPLNAGKSVSDAEETPSETPANPTAPDDLEEDKPKSGLRKFFGIMPFWAWVLTLGLIATIIAGVTAYATMRSTETGSPGSASSTEQLKPSYPKPTTTGKYDDDDTKPTPDAGPGYGGYQNYYAPQVPQTTEQTETETSEENKPSEGSKPAKPAKPSKSPKPSPGRNPGGPSVGGQRPGGNVGGNAGGTSGNGNTGTGNGNSTGTGTGAGTDSDAGAGEYDE
ncbi:hypothetical protein ACN4DQ_05170 [Corynebacterium macclintockiae]|uniref:hypothetical protein n=1 Tax=Corynebacterium macclintockiae TaxID=2913501 RepID=UPI003EB9B645